MRTIVDIPESELNSLEHLCAEEDISRAEAIRRAIRDYLHKNSHARPEAFGLWKNRKIDAVEYQNRLREEW